MLSNILSIIGGIASFTAIVALFVELRMSRLTLQTEAILHLSDTFVSDRMIKIRQTASRNILMGEVNNGALSEVLDNFSIIAFLGENGAIDLRTVNDMFGYWIIYYVIAGKHYMESERKADPYSWQNVERYANKLQKYNDFSGLDTSHKGIQLFLLKEAYWTISDFEKEKIKNRDKVIQNG